MSNATKTENDNVSIHILPAGSWNQPRVMVHRKFMADDRAEFAMVLMKQHAMVCAQDNGEDSAGRQKVRRETAQEIVQFCSSLASMAYDEFHRRGWMIQSPDLPEITADDDEPLVRTYRSLRPASPHPITPPSAEPDVQDGPVQLAGHQEAQETPEENKPAA